MFVQNIKGLLIALAKNVDHGKILKNASVEEQQSAIERRIMLLPVRLQQRLDRLSAPTNDPVLTLEDRRENAPNDELVPEAVEVPAAAGDTGGQDALPDRWHPDCQWLTGYSEACPSLWAHYRSVN